MNNVSTHPDWQTTVRQAQAEMNRRTAEDQARRDQQEADRQRNLGADLAKALRHFGITVDTPEQNEIVLNDFVFSIADEGYYTIGDQIRFALHIWKAKPDHIDSDDWNGAHQWVAVRQPDLDSDWTPTLHAFACALDDVAYRYESLLRQYEASGDRQQKQTNPPAPALDQQLADLIRRIVREELDGA